MTKGVLGAFLMVSTAGFGGELVGGNKLPSVRFKDGTILENVKIHLGKNGQWRPRVDGVTLEVGGRIYFHHYPYREVRRSYSLPAPDKGEYALTTVTRAFRIPTPHPPKEEHWNPNGIPECAPSRIQFIHFDANTLNSMYKIIDATVKHYEKDPKSALSHHYRAVRDSIRENAWHKLRPHELNTPVRSRTWQVKVEKEMQLHWRKIHYGKWIHQKK